MPKALEIYRFNGERSEPMWSLITIELWGGRSGEGCLQRWFTQRLCLQHLQGHFLPSRPPPVS
jgi:hypothetical protein